MNLCHALYLTTMVASQQQWLLANNGIFQECEYSWEGFTGITVGRKNRKHASRACARRGSDNTPTQKKPKVSGTPKVPL